MQGILFIYWEKAKMILIDLNICIRYAELNFPRRHILILMKNFDLHETVSSLISKKIIESAHDISEGGLFVTLAESGFFRSLGF